jgi:integrase
VANLTLTAQTVEHVHRSGSPVTLCDGSGLYFRKQSVERASWVLRYKFAGRPRWMKLGDYPDMSLAEARKQARAERVKLDKAIDPIEERNRELQRQRSRGSFQELAEEWFDAEIKGRVKHPQIQRRHLDNHWIPALGKLKADEVTAGDATRLLRKVRMNAPTTANDLLRCIQRIYAHGLRNRIVTASPVASLTTTLDAGGVEKPRSRALTRDELEKLLKAMPYAPGFGVSNTLAVKLLLALCVRKGELLAAKWNAFDLDDETSLGAVWRLNGGRTKTGDGLDIPLSTEAVAWLRQLRVLAGNSEYLFPKRRHDKRSRFPHLGVDTLNAALQSIEHGLDHFTVHDLRRTARTLLASLGVRSEVAERCLNHKLKGIEATYNKHDYFDERRSALSQLASLIVDLEQAKPKVVSLRRA